MAAKATMEFYHFGRHFEFLPDSSWHCIQYESTFIQRYLYPIWCFYHLLRNLTTIYLTTWARQALGKRQKHEIKCMIWTLFLVKLNFVDTYKLFGSLETLLQYQLGLIYSFRTSIFENFGMKARQYTMPFYIDCIWNTRTYS